MSLGLFAGTASLAAAKPDPERGHRWRLGIAAALTLAALVAVAVYGADYYLLESTQRPFSEKHALLKPSGAVGLKLGFCGFLMFIGIFLYPIRKRWPWLARRGSSKHWLDFHVLLGLSAPIVIALHSSFKIRGLAGMAFWIMLAVALSGIVGRYLYAQIPRSLSAAELSLKELKAAQEQITQQLAEQWLFTAGDLAPLFRLPSAERVAQMSAPHAMLLMLALDVLRPLHVVRLRQRALGLGEWFSTFGGLLSSGNPELERIITAAQRQATLSKRIVFLSRAQEVFKLWHVVHKPFSYSFIVLAGAHIGVVMLLGFI